MNTFNFVVGYPYCNPILLEIEAKDTWDALEKALDELESERELDLTLITDITLK